MTTKFKPIAMKCSQEQFESIKPILIQNNFKIRSISDSWDVICYLTNNYLGNKGVITNIVPANARGQNRTAFDEWDQDVFLIYCGITTKQNKNNMGYKLTVPITDVLKIHAIACDNWKTKISEKYLSRVDKNQNITFTEGEVDTMVVAATPEQLLLIKEIFGEKKKVIDYWKLKTGSRVMIKPTGHNIFNHVDINKSVDILFYNVPYYMDFDGVFKKEGRYSNYVVFTQDGKFATFAAHEEIDYITEVIEY